MISRYHAGELAVQTRAGVQVEAERLGQMIGSSIQPVVQDFLSSQQMAIASTVGKDGQVWASLLTGERSFVQAISAQTVRIDAIPVRGDPLKENLMLQDDIGILVIDLATRRRVRINGKAELDPDGSIYVHTNQVYFNCPKYIQLRKLDTNTAESQTLRHQYTKTLTNEQQQWIAQTDTFFIASYHPEGADASHRRATPRNIGDIYLPCHDPYHAQAAGRKSHPSKLFKHPLSCVLTGTDATLNPEAGEAAIRASVAQVLPALSSLSGTWHHCLVSFRSDRLPLIGSIPGIEGIHIFSGLSNPLVIVPPLAQRFANCASGGEDEIIRKFSPIRFTSVSQ